MTHSTVSFKRGINKTWCQMSSTSTDIKEYMTFLFTVKNV